MKKRSITDRVAEAIARSELTEKGKRDCVWLKSWAASEREQYRRLARVAIAAIKGVN